MTVEVDLSGLSPRTIGDRGVEKQTYWLFQHGEQGLASTAGIAYSFWRRLITGSFILCGAASVFIYRMKLFERTGNYPLRT